ncbi:MAG: ABC-F family ATP-binding cassette domain-containing protein [Firmicutes bacterium]|nr:ABC-F family ATP-binding cassette domain-containing protein [Bacillota bacterium]
MQIAAGHNLGMTYVTEELFRDVTFTVDSSARIGLVGANGAGKTTLFRIICGELEPSEGQVILNRDCRLAYMEQFLTAAEEESLYQAVLHIFDPLMELEERLARVNARLEGAGGAASLIAEQHRLQEEYADRGGYTYRARLRSTLLGLGFSEDDFPLPVSALSGGQRSKAALAKVLLSEADLLLLDEPTNHLDVDSIHWLEGFLATRRGAFIVISHDRYFLDQATNETWDLHHGRLHRYAGNYSRHLEQRKSEEDSLRRRYENQMREIRRVEGIIEQQRRFNQARNYVTIASKQHQLDRLRAELELPEARERSLHFSFNVPPPGGNEVVELHQVSKAFPGKTLFFGADLRVEKGERVFLLGPNGAGKSTIMKMILGRIPADRGTVRLGANVIPAYYDQLHGHISGPETVLEHFTEAYPRLTQTEIRTMLGTFLFSGEEVEKTLDMLSGGEKARLELMKLILQPANLLLLDEPTNHLDIASMEAVEAALLAYPGTMLVVSHDRYLINKLADRIYYLQEDCLVESIGDYDDLLHTLEKRKARLAEGEAPAAAAPAQPVSDAAAEYRRRKEELAAARRHQKQIERAQEKIAALEQTLEELDGRMNDPALAADYQALMELQEQKDRAEADYLAALEELEALEQEES